VWMLENSIYSVISPEGCASILWKDSSKVKEAAECLKLTANDMLKNGVVERVIGEDGRDFSEIYEDLRNLLSQTIETKSRLEIEELLEQRYQRFRKFGM
ncbi:MAG: acetyl-CoA carboxylase carboxyl transferase subunit alpha, partial [Bacillota bacterium]|nr:acetyl-CoA carboxylase carboxyl transferase subunit alpha [Bacillota bacterium]